jgi:hypothetical protein
MVKQYKVNLNEEQLTRLIAMAKKGTMSRTDRELIEYLEYIQKHQGIQQGTLDWVVTSKLDEIPF